jgi:hypothetical protein
MGLDNSTLPVRTESGVNLLCESGSELVMEPSALGPVGYISDIHAGRATTWSAGQLDALNTQLQSTPTVGWIFNGDLIDEGDDTTDLTIFEASFGTAELTGHALNGNHEEPLDPFPVNFTWDVGPYRFVGFDMTTYFNAGNGFYDATMTAPEIAAVGVTLAAAVAAGKTPIIVTHIPLYSSTNDAQLLAGSGQEGMLALCSTYGVPLALSGHNHPFGPLYSLNAGTGHYSGLAAMGPYAAPLSYAAAYQVLNLYLDHIDINAYSSLSPFAALWSRPFRIWLGGTP